MDGEGENVGVLCRVGEGIRWMVGGGRGGGATGGDEDGPLNGKREVGGGRRR